MTDEGVVQASPILHDLFRGGKRCDRMPPDCATQSRGDGYGIQAVEQRAFMGLAFVLSLEFLAPAGAHRAAASSGG
jgi:hypothetical protein